MVNFRWVTKGFWVGNSLGPSATGQISGRWQMAQGRMGSHIVVINAPSLNQYTGLCKIVKPVGVQALIAQAAVEAFDESVLHGLAEARDGGLIKNPLVVVRA